jgi:hypothetical protein
MKIELKMKAKTVDIVVRRWRYHLHCQADISPKDL